MVAAGLCSPLTTIAAALLATACSIGLAGPVLAQQDAAPATRAAPAQTTPKPTTAKAAKPAQPAPPKPQKLESGPMPKAPAAKNAPGSPSLPALPSPPPARLQPLPPIDTSTPPPLLPRASRERMRACAEEWDQMKRRGTAGLPTWREFATQCLTRQSRGEEEQAQ
ncbi:hypothetical protein [Methylocystis echinoides]|uniref:hypothetical protein n=1 Tax=Methylocystis echinoides TaxID=29468 RepID=UPI00341D1EDC